MTITETLPEFLLARAEDYTHETGDPCCCSCSRCKFMFMIMIAAVYAAHPDYRQEWKP